MTEQTDRDDLGRGEAIRNPGEALAGGTVTLSAQEQRFVDELQASYPGYTVTKLEFADDGTLDEDKMLEAAEAAHKAQPLPPTGETPNKQNGHTGISEITYPCGCQAKGQGNLPEHCPEHPEHKVEVPRDGHGNAFDPEIHAVNRHDGSPKLDSANKFIGKEHDYPGPPENKFFGS